LLLAMLGLLSMGALDAALYYPVALALPAAYPNINDIHGDWVWPTLIVVGMLWSLGFLLAGALNHALEKRRMDRTLRRLAYVLVLWAWALLLWWVALYGR
jgi:hypothetical protein